MGISIQTREVGLLSSLTEKQTEKTSSYIPALLILFSSFPPVFTHVEKNRHFLHSLQVNLCKKFFFLESKFLCISLYIYIHFFFSHSQNTLSLHLEETLKTFENITCWVAPWMEVNYWPHVFILGYMWITGKLLS